MAEIQDGGIRGTAILERGGKFDLPQFAAVLRAGGWTSEWHLVFANTFADVEFGFGSWFHQQVIGHLPAFLLARLEAIRSVGYSMN